MNQTDCILTYAQRFYSLVLFDKLNSPIVNSEWNWLLTTLQGTPNNKQVLKDYFGNREEGETRAIQKLREQKLSVSVVKENTDRQRRDSPVLERIGRRTPNRKKIKISRKTILQQQSEPKKVLKIRRKIQNPQIRLSHTERHNNVNGKYNLTPLHNSLQLLLKTMNNTHKQL